MRLEAARALTYSAADRSGRQTDDVSYFGAAAKCFASDTAMAVCTDAVQLLGGIGYSKDSAVERMFRDVRGLAIGAGTVEVQKNLIARLLDRQGENEPI